MKKQVWHLMFVFSVLLGGCGAPAPTPLAPSPVAATATTVVDDRHTVTIATLDWLPYVGESLQEYGFTAAIVRAAFERSGYKVVFSFMPWARGLQETEAGKYDAIFPAYYSEDRVEKYIYTKPFSNGPLVFYKKKGASIQYTTLEGLKPYRIGVVRGFVNTAEFDAADYLQKEEVDTDEQNLRKLALGRLDLVVVDKFVAQTILSTTFTEGKNALEPVEPPLDLKPLYLMLSRQIPDGQALADAFDKGLEEIVKDGTFDKILARFGLEK